MTDFEKALQHVLKWEGFVSKDPNDKGGLTIWGISSRSYPGSVPQMELLIDEGKKDEAFEIAKKIYYENYWLKLGCQDIDYPLNIILFDTAVNMGKSKAMALLKETVKGDWNWKDYLLLRLYTYSKFKQAKLYFRGWSNRTLDLYKLIKG